MNTQTRSRIARSAAFAVAASITAVTTTIVAAPTTASPAPAQERPCFIVQPRWNIAIDGPVPRCPTPSWQRTAGRVSEDAQDVNAPSTRGRIDFGDEYGSPR